MLQSPTNCHVMDFHCQEGTLQEIIYLFMPAPYVLFWWINKFQRDPATFLGDIHNSGSEFVYIMYCVSNRVELHYIIFFNNQIHASFFTKDFSIVSSNVFQAGCLKNYFVNRFLEYRILWAIARRMKAIKKNRLPFSSFDRSSIPNITMVTNA